ncbi:MFS transporter [Methanolobus sp. WCC4]|uniref:MFS transporter n=1 Tax=Methanolobus sp. WCC4 TaxID=3125784 RepID=UPI0030F96BA8
MEFKRTHLLMLCVTAFFAMAGSAILAPVLPEMVAPLNTTSHEIGLMISVYTISTAIFTLVIGHFIDRVNRKRILVPCLVLYGLMGLISYFVSDLQSLLIMRFIQGIGVAGMMSLSMLIIGDVYKGHDSLHAMSRVSMAIAIGTVSAPLIGGGLAILGWNYPFLFYALSLPFAVLVIFFLPETSVKKENDSHKGIINVLPALRDLRILYTVFLSFAIFFLLFSVVIYMPFMLKATFAYTAKQAGYVLAFQGMAVIIMASRVKVLVAKYSMIQVITAGFALVGLAILSIPFANSIVTVLLLMLIFGAGYGLAQTTNDAQIIRISPPESRGGVLSMHNTMKYTGQSLSPIVLGVVLLHSNLDTVFMISGILGLLIALTTYLMKGQFERTDDVHVKNTKISLPYSACPEPLDDR